MVHLLELLAAVLDALKPLVEDRDLLLVLLVRNGDFVELGLLGFKLVVELVGLGLALLLLHGEHDLHARGQVRVDYLPLVRVRRQEHLLVDDEVLEGVKPNHVLQLCLACPRFTASSHLNISGALLAPIFVATLLLLKIGDLASELGADVGKVFFQGRAPVLRQQQLSPGIVKLHLDLSILCLQLLQELVQLRTHLFFHKCCLCVTLHMTRLTG